MDPKNTAINAVSEFVGRLKLGGVRVKEAFLFGSYSSGQYTAHSDIDVAVISPDFSGFRFDDLGKIAKYKVHSHPDLEVHTFAVSEFTAANPYAQEIMEKGLKIA